eukprot:3007642-Prymnesium_polylepis.1
MGSLVPGYQHQPQYQIRPNQQLRIGYQRLVRVMFDISCAGLSRLAVRPPIWGHLPASKDGED